MITSTLTFYVTDINIEKNLCIDNIAGYLSGITKKLTKSNFQYIKHDLQIEIKVDAVLETTPPITPFNKLDDASSFPYNYVSIQNSNESKAVYYFVYKSEWRSNGCVRLTLVMDTINTFQEFENHFTDRTMVLREHKDLAQATCVETNDVLYFPRIVDKYFEDITPQLYRVSNKVIKQTYGANENYYLVYRAEHDLDDQEHSSNPVKCYLYSKNGNITASMNRLLLYTAQIGPKMRSDNIYFYFNDTGLSFYLGNSRYRENDYIIGETYTETIDGVNVYGTLVGIGITVVQVGDAYSDWLIGGILEDANHDLHHFTIENSYTSPFIVLYLTNSAINTTITTYYKAGAFEDDERQWDLYTWGMQTISNVDMTDAKLVKVIEIPYLPIKSSSTSSFAYDDGYKWVYNGLNGNGRYELDIITDEFSETKIFDADEITETNVAVTQFADWVDLDDLKIYIELQGYYANWESKQFNSSFYTIKMVYDSFTLDFPLETYSFSALATTRYNCKIYFKMTSTINSKLGFKTEFATISNPYVDFPNYLLVSRNNEKTIYTSNYLNYLRSGYNYDKKNKELSKASGWIATGVAVAGGMIAGAKLGATGGPYGAIAGAIIGGIGAGVTSSINAIQNSVKTENAWQSKIAQLKEQSASIESSDDIDLFNWYSSNKVRLMRYRCSDVVRDQLIDLFMYYGYKTNEYKVPSFNNRIFWDFLQCQAVFDGIFIAMGTRELIDNIVNDIKSRLEIGVTFIHEFIDGDLDVDLFDIKQEHNNIPVNIYNILKAKAEEL